MKKYVLNFSNIDKAKFSEVGGKGANLGELSKIKEINVPEGFCITTEAYKEIIENNLQVNSLLNELTRLKVEARENISALATKIRTIIERIAIPKNIEEKIVACITRLGEENAYAVRSSATLEDLPVASAAGQQDTYLNVIGTDEILTHISKCWASLFTDRAVIYRIQNGFDHRKVCLSVIVQRMVFPQASGILFTADPITGNRKLISIDAGFGLGEALVSGLVNADVYKVRDGKIVDKKISNKKLAIYASKDGGTKEKEVEYEQQNKQALADDQIFQLVKIGRRIEEHFGHPQDIEWCLVDDTFYIVQSRPITTLYPIPVANDKENHVYVSVGHQQMMTDAMKPLGISIWQLTAARPMYEAGGRLFVDVTQDLASPARRNVLINVLGKSDPLIKDALTTIVEREDFIKLSDDKQGQDSNKGNQAGPRNYQALNEYDQAIVDELVKRSEGLIEELDRNIQAKSGTELVDFIFEDIKKLKKHLADPQSFGVIMTGMNASSWINEKMNEWLGEKNVADTISQSVSNNITSEMGLALLDVADAIRPYPEVIEFLQHAKDDNFLNELNKFNGGKDAKDAINNYLNKYGMRCAGEIDITKARWAEKPTILVPLILSNIKNFEPGAGKRKFEEGRQEALQKEKEILEQLRQLENGYEKAEETKRMISLVRNFIGYREYPKYHIVSRYFAYKKALLKEAEQLVHDKMIHEIEDIYYLSLEELREVIAHIGGTVQFDLRLIDQRRAGYKLYEKLAPPRVITSDGEVITGRYNRSNLPAKAIVGLAVSAGVVEGRARVILNMEDANLEDGDILVTRFTDPSWTPLFVSIKGLVTEVGGLMTHGAVIAREYGLPAVIGVESATRLIKDGQRIRVNGTEGYVEVV
jgi:rifampicin phosphotransferase